MVSRACVIGLALVAPLLTVACGGPPRPGPGADQLDVWDWEVDHNHGTYAYHTRARLRVQRGLFAGAVADCDAYLNHKQGKPKSSTSLAAYRYELHDIYALRSAANEGLQDYAAALADIDRAMEADRANNGSRSIAAHRQARGRLLCLSGRLDEAESMAVAMLEPGPDSPEFDNGIGLLSLVYSLR
jgi:tetratricopeptide (TPR) repeat protein